MSYNWQIDSRSTGQNRVRWGELAFRAAISLGLALGMVWLLANRLAHLDFTALGQSFASLQPAQWAAALALTGVSFWAVGRYDAALHRHFATGIPEQVSRRAGVCAIAVSQTLGLGLISGAVLRWRMLPGISFWQATRLTAAVALSFLAGWAVVTSAVLLVFPGAPFKPWALLAALLALAAAALCLAAPRLPGLRFRWPNGFTLGKLVGLCAVDTLAAAAAFHVLLPVELSLGFAVLLPAFLLALGAGLALGTPGGVGTFEVTLLTLLPHVEPTQLLAALLAWRAVYYALPAVIGAGLAILGPVPTSAPPRPDTRLPARHPAECGLLHQRFLKLESIAARGWLVGRTGHGLVALADPLETRRRKDLDRAVRGLKRLALQESRLPAFYKASARIAARARAAGWRVRRTGWEAVIDPSAYQLGASSRAGLRRKLRRAEAAGVTVGPVSPEAAPWAALDRIASDWAKAHGGERGFSMGRHARDYLARQRLYVAWHGDQAIAFASFHVAPGEWALDLMRHGSDLPDGTMHSLVQAAITDAGRTGLTRLSLAAVAQGAVDGADLSTRLLSALVPETAQAGLLRFKSAFAPRWRPLYVAAPGALALVLSGMSLWRAITRPPPLMPEIERDDEDYGFALAPAPWHIARTDV